MDTKELKFLLKLIGQDNYQGKIQDLKPNSKTPMSITRGICRDLRDRELVECSVTITKIKISSAGKALLKLEGSAIPISSDELKILQACTTAIKKSQLKITPAKKRDELIDSLVEKGLLVAAETKIERVSISDRGKQFLAKEYHPQGTGSVLSLNLLNNYLNFLRKYPRQSQPEVAVNGNGSKPNLTATSNGTKPNDKKILQTIIELDREQGTNNYLPIFHLRGKLQPPLARKELDEALYRLQKADKLELSSLVEAMHYTPEQIDAGIPQNVGGALFFLTVN